MAFIFNKVSGPTITGSVSWWTLKQLLVSAGWVVKSSGDGLSAFSSSSDIVSQSSTGANGLSNANAWFRIQMPSISGITRELLVQTNTSAQLTIKYSFSAGFTGGSPSATALPTATDSQTLVINTWAATSSFHCYMGADNAAPYGFFACVALNNATSSNNSGGFLLEPMLSGSGPPLDPDPYVLYSETSSSGSFNVTKISGSLGCGWIGKGLTEEIFVGTSSGTGISGTIISAQSSGQIFPNFAGTNPYTLNDQIAPILWIRNVSSSSNNPVSIKGMGTIMKWNGTQKQYGDTMSINSPRDRLCFIDVNFPWDGTVPPL